MGEAGQLRPGQAMLSVPTLWTVIVMNFLALGLVWAYVTRSYPEIRCRAVLDGLGAWPRPPARHFHAAQRDGFAAPADRRRHVMIFAACLAAMGIRRFYDKPVSWPFVALVERAQRRRPRLLPGRDRQYGDAHRDLFARAVDSARTDAATAAVTARWTQKSRRPARRYRGNHDRRHLRASRGCAHLSGRRRSP